MAGRFAPFFAYFIFFGYHNSGGLRRPIVFLDACQRIIMKIDQDTVVTVRYTLSVSEGETPEYLDKQFTTRFVYGRERVLPNLAKALAGREPQDTVEVTIPPEQAFGRYDPQLVKEIPLADLKFPKRLRRGQFHEETGVGGKMVRFLVKEMRDGHVVADFNHPAAGKKLILKATVAEVHAASLLEIMTSMNVAQGAGGG
jgi:FKBP-type peptidyl-prolyl cis-trans isomerase SlyD